MATETAAGAVDWTEARAIAALEEKQQVMIPGPREESCVTITEHDDLPPVPPVRVDFSEEDKDWIASKIKEVLNIGRLTLGKYGKAFEGSFATLVGTQHAIAVNSGTAALEITFRILDVADKDVLVPADTFFATAAAVIAAGGRPVLMDTDLETLSTTLAEVEQRLTSKTAAIVVVHIAGAVTSELPAIVEFAQRKGLSLIEDAAHAHGATLHGKAAGSFGTAGCFSFYPTKVMTCGEGGMIVTDDDRLAEEARILRDQGKASFLENRHIRMGYNWRMPEPNAIIGLRHLEHLGAMVAARRRIAARYDAALANGQLGLHPMAIPEGSEPNRYKYVAWLSDGVDRAAFKLWMRKEHGVIFGGEVYEVPLQSHPVFEHLDSGDLPGSLIGCGRHVCLPMFASITDDEVARVLDAVADANKHGLLS